ncbi:MAG: hypothetical protein JXA69_08620 [Phycisphaerae bacterium]|nr:hypothetical protein [Phycisphaerae bacterium]
MTTRERMLAELKKGTAEDLDGVLDELIWRATIVAEITRRMKWQGMRSLMDMLEGLSPDYDESPGGAA